MVFRLWQEWQRLSRLAGSVISHLGGRRPQAPAGALPAEGLPQELAGTEIVRPNLPRVPPPPRRRFLGPGLLLRPVGGAVAVPGQLAAPRMPAGPDRLHGHGLSPPGKTKSLNRHARILRIMWLRLIGSGSNRYSGTAPVYTDGSIQTPSLCRPGANGEASLSGTPGRTPIRPLRQVYHVSFSFARWFLLFVSCPTTFQDGITY